MVEKWIDVAKFAAHVGVSKSVVYALCQQGLISCTRVGLSWRIAMPQADEDLMKIGPKGFSRERARKYNRGMAALDAAREKYMKEAVG